MTYPQVRCFAFTSGTRTQDGLAAVSHYEHQQWFRFGVTSRIRRDKIIQFCRTCRRASSFISRGYHMQQYPVQLCTCQSCRHWVDDLLLSDSNRTEDLPLWDKLIRNCTASFCAAGCCVHREVLFHHVLIVPGVAKFPIGHYLIGDSHPPGPECFAANILYDQLLVQKYSWISGASQPTFVGKSQLTLDTTYSCEGAATPFSCTDTNSSCHSFALTSYASSKFDMLPPKQFRHGGTSSHLQIDCGWTSLLDLNFWTYLWKVAHNPVVHYRARLVDAQGVLAQQSTYHTPLGCTYNFSIQILDLPAGERFLIPDATHLALSKYGAAVVHDGHTIRLGNIHYSFGGDELSIFGVQLDPADLVSEDRSHFGLAPAACYVSDGPLHLPVQCASFRMRHTGVFDHVLALYEFCAPSTCALTIRSHRRQLVILLDPCRYVVLQPQARYFHQGVGFSLPTSPRIQVDYLEAESQIRVTMTMWNSIGTLLEMFERLVNLFVNLPIAIAGLHPLDVVAGSLVYAVLFRGFAPPRAATLLVMSVSYLWYRYSHFFSPSPI